MEETRTNSLASSNDFTSGNWVKTTATMTVDAVTQGPEGSANSSNLIPTNGNIGSIHQDISCTLNTWYSFSIFAKAKALDVLRLRVFPAMFTSGVAQDYSFDLTTGAVAMITGSATESRAFTQQFGNGWYRCILSFRPTITNSSGIRVRSDVAGNGTNSFNIWGAQLEQGEEQTSYYATTGGALTRQLDLCTLATTLFNWNNTTWTIYNKAMTTYPLGGVTLASSAVGTGATSNRTSMNLARSADGFCGYTITVGGASQDSRPVGGAQDPLTLHKLAVAAQVGLAESAVNGVAGNPGAPASLPTCTMAILGGNANTSSSSMLNGSIAEFLSLPRKMTQAELQTLTS
jgi:hypothetical protein